MIDEHLLCFACNSRSKDGPGWELIRLRMRQEVESIQAFLKCRSPPQLTPQAFIQVAFYIKSTHPYHADIMYQQSCGSVKPKL